MDWKEAEGKQSTWYVLEEGFQHRRCSWARPWKITIKLINCLLKQIRSSNLFSWIFKTQHKMQRGLLRWLSEISEESSCQGMRHTFDPWVRMIPWRRKWQPTQVFLHGKSHVQRSLAGYSPWSCKRVRHDLTNKQKQTCEEQKANKSIQEQWEYTKVDLNY